LGIIVSLLVSMACLILAPAVLPEGYSVVANTVREAAAQTTEGAWLARTGLFLFGLGAFWLSVSKRSWAVSARFLHGTFGVLMIATAVYSHRPVLGGGVFDQVEDTLHSIAATAMGFAFALGVLVVGWRRVSGWKPIDFLALVATVAVPIGMTMTTGYAGLWQRAMFGIAYLWYLVEAVDTHRSVALDLFG
jgi:hypothetical protein